MTPPPTARQSRPPVGRLCDRCVVACACWLSHGARARRPASAPTEPRERDAVRSIPRRPTHELEELRSADRRRTSGIDVTSDTGDLGRARRRDPATATCRSAWASACSRPTKPRSTRTSAASSLNGNVEYLDPHAARQRARAVRSGRQASRRVRGREVRTARPRRCVARPRCASVSRRRADIDLKGVAVHGLPGRQRRLAARAPARSRSTRRRASAPVATCGSSFSACRSSTCRGSRSRSATSASPACCFPTIGSSGKSGTLVAVPYYWNLAPELRRDADRTRYYSSRGLRARPGVALPRREHAQPVERRIPVPRHRAWRMRAVCVDWRHVTRLCAAHAAADRCRQRQRPGLFRGFRRRLRGHERHVREPLWPSCATTPTTGRFDARAQDYQVIDQALADEDEPYQIAAAVRRRSGRWDDLGRRLRASLLRRSHELRARRRSRKACASMPSRRSTGASTATARSSTADAGYRYTQYYARRRRHAAPTIRRTAALPMASLDAGLVLERAAGSQGQRLQTLEPRLLYLYVPYPQPGRPARLRHGHSRT